jgi:hypothetical protein
LPIYGKEKKQIGNDKQDGNDDEEWQGDPVQGRIDGVSDEMIDDENGGKYIREEKDGVEGKNEVEHFFMLTCCFRI